VAQAVGVAPAVMAQPPPPPASAASKLSPEVAACPVEPPDAGGTVGRWDPPVAPAPSLPVRVCPESLPSRLVPPEAAPYPPNGETQTLAAGAEERTDPPVAPAPAESDTATSVAPRSSQVHTAGQSASVAQLGVRGWQVPGKLAEVVQVSPLASGGVGSVVEPPTLPVPPETGVREPPEPVLPELPEPELAEPPEPPPDPPMPDEPLAAPVPGPPLLPEQVVVMVG